MTLTPTVLIAALHREAEAARKRVGRFGSNLEAAASDANGSPHDVLLWHGYGAFCAAAEHRLYKMEAQTVRLALRENPEITGAELLEDRIASNAERLAIDAGEQGVSTSRSHNIMARARMRARAELRSDLYNWKHHPALLEDLQGVPAVKEALALPE